MITSSRLGARSNSAIVIGAICTTFAYVASAQTAGSSPASPNVASLDPVVLSCVIQVSGKINAFKPKYEQAVKDGKVNATQKVAIDAVIEKEKDIARDVKEKKAVTLAQCNGADKNVTEADKLLTTALASGGQNASPAKYEQVASVMKEVFTGGDLGPNSRAVKHAADVDMPARGGNPEALKTYLNSQNGTVKNWYKTNFGLTYADNSAALAAAPAARPAWFTACIADIARERTSFDAALRKGVADGKIDAKEKADLDRTHGELLLLEKKVREDHKLSQSECKGVEAKIAEENKKLAAALASNARPAAPAKYEQVASVMKQVFTGGDLGQNSRAVKHAADVDMPARGGTPEALLSYLNSQNGVVKGWYRTNFGLSIAEVVAPPVATAPAAGVESPQDVALNNAAMDLGKTREPLPALPETASLVGQARQFSDNLSQVVSAMKSGGGFDDATTAQLAGIVEAMRFLASGSPYSLQNLANGGAVALNSQELHQVDALIAASGAVEDMRRMNTALLDAVREVQPEAVVWKEWPDAPRIRLAAMGELPLNLPAFAEFGRQTVNLSALDRTQRLVMVLKIANGLKTASAFSGGSLTLDTKINGVLDSIQQAMGIDPKKAGKDGAKQVMSPEKFREFMKASGKYLKVVSIAKLTTEWIQTLSQLAGWLMPDTIVGFYAQAGNSRSASTWEIKKDGVVAMSLYVVPQVSGGGNVLTPNGLAAKAVDAVKIPFLDRITGELGKRLETKAKEFLKTFVQTQTQQMLAKINVGSGPLVDWTRSDKDTFSLPAKSLEPVEVNDRRVVNMSVIPAAAPQVVLDNPGRFTILGKQAGNVTVRGYIHNPDLLRYVKTAGVLAMSVTVVEDAPPKPALPVAIADPTPKVNNKGQPVVVPAGPPHPLVGNEVYMSRGLWDCVNEISVPLVPLPNPWIDPSIIGTNCGAK